ncbi:CpsB/CapC family capsule biosynthesis tyrosine phosphatase [Conexibacter sp. JD483]|uniref:tyrosine-protein phosphatase n=1 Tax=unclassified Conexibacter TaxID=2627773 RepID=UPI002725B5BD|nr:MULTISPECIES: CpsB/CapC family capsule biosynthesis tyrosine phosphatase [unclassified Conexibacter]MDO8185887.1 CpsB/CapC family capsule biosynthesis tyrosine phosphatase [Conexibacter sp. CPCC 205706]MDO8199378.1 CpsB/CapC family capsule biosynthesis tyrosine phosphatase [Conexibacter sp. CPCC 205762]MDR9371278.1 CpsB/CapC family capsule biosynthesis tyrosine phosphatase [Conexibacter sp. JD483]
MIDLHCHLLPAIDDGPPDLGAALRLAQAQAAAGVRTVAVTPHAIAAWPNDEARIARGLIEMRTALRAASIPLELVHGAEVDLRWALGRSDEELSGLTLDGGRWLLLESPLTATAPLEEGVATLRRRGFEILLAHPERAPLLQREPQQVARLVRAGVRTQVTAGALEGRFGRHVQRCALALMESGLAHTFASDSHSAERRRPGLREPLEQAGFGAAVRLLCEEHPAMVLAGQAPPETVALKRRRGLLGRLRG